MVFKIRLKIDLDLLSHAAVKTVFPWVHIVMSADILTSGVVGVCEVYVLTELYLKQASLYLSQKESIKFIMSFK